MSEQVEGWMHECKKKGREIWWPAGEGCMWCWMSPPTKAKRGGDPDPIKERVAELTLEL